MRKKARQAKSNQQREEERRRKTRAHTDTQRAAKKIHTAMEKSVMAIMLVCQCLPV